MLVGYPVDLYDIALDAISRVERNRRKNQIAVARNLTGPPHPREECEVPNGI